MSKNLELVIRKRVKPIITSKMHEVLGVTIEELNEDITEKLQKNPLLDFPIDTSMPFKQAKKKFKKQYLRRVLQIYYGNVSEAAKVVDMDRRTLHRIAKEEGIEVKGIRQKMAKVYHIKEHAISGVIEETLDQYKGVIHPEKLDNAYHHVSDVSKEIMESLPEKPPTLKEAEEEFEKRFLKKALQEHNKNITRTAAKIGLRYETLHRKAKKYGLV
jgi:DNA-binding NtrC family response regulator